MSKSHYLVKTNSRYPWNTSYELRYLPNNQTAYNTRSVFNDITPHLSTNSVYLAGIGVQWEKESWQKVVDMVSHTNESGVTCWLSEIPDACVSLPYHSINYMKNQACLNAHNQGFDYLMIIDNDILPEPDLILKLLKWQVPVIVPFIVDESKGTPISGPAYEPNSGLKLVNWTVQSCMLIWTKVLNCFPNRQPWCDYMDEGVFSQNLLQYGHRIYQDTDVQLKIANPPTYHGGLETLADLWGFLEKSHEKRKRPPDRSFNGVELYLSDGWENA